MCWCMYSYFTTTPEENVAVFSILGQFEHFGLKHIRTIPSSSQMGLEPVTFSFNAEKHPSQSSFDFLHRWS